MARVLVTGGAGFIGRHVVRLLLQQGYTVRVFDSLIDQVHGNAERDPVLRETELIRADVRDLDRVTESLKGVDYVIHLAAEVGVGQSMYAIDRYVSANDGGTAVLFQALIDRPVKRVVTASSMSIYGEGLYRTADGILMEDVVRATRPGREWDPRGPDGTALIPMPTPESKRPNLTSVYALTKFVQERLTMTVGPAYGIESTALRLFNVYGPGQALSNPYTGVLAIFASRMQNNERPMVFEDGEQRRDFVHVDDVARAFVLAMTHSWRAGPGVQHRQRARCEHPAGGRGAGRRHGRAWPVAGGDVQSPGRRHAPLLCRHQPRPHGAGVRSPPHLCRQPWRDGGVGGQATGRRPGPACPGGAGTAGAGRLMAHVLVTGGAGFIGSNLADRLAGLGHDVLLLDTLARPGVERNLDWLRRRHPARIRHVGADLRDADAVARAVRGASAVFHMAAQVAVTTSLADPVMDFDVNLRGTLNVLEALRRAPVPLVFASTNKVYGALGDIPLVDDIGPYVPSDPGLRAHGISEDRPLSFYTPYGCSKGAADQYVLDYARGFGVPACVLRMSCIYGPRQLGTEDQGWLAHFLYSARAGQPISIFGDGRQVRDVLYVDDAVDAYIGAWQRIGQVSGTAYNLGGGPGNAVTLQQVLAEIGAIIGRAPDVRYAAWRPGDQRYFVADTRRVTAALGLAPPVGWADGLRRLDRWIAGEALLARDAA